MPACSECKAAVEKDMRCPGCLGAGPTYCQPCFKAAWKAGHKKTCPGFPPHWRAKFRVQPAGETIFTELGRLGYAGRCVSTPSENPDEAVVKEWVFTPEDGKCKIARAPGVASGPLPPGDPVYRVDHILFAQILGFLAAKGNQAVFDKFVFGLVLPWDHIPKWLVLGGPGDVLRRQFLAPRGVFLSLGLFTRNAGRWLFGPDARGRYLGLARAGPCRLTEAEWVAESVAFIAGDAKREDDPDALGAVARIAGVLDSPDKWRLYEDLPALLGDHGEDEEVRLE